MNKRNLIIAALAVVSATTVFAQSKEYKVTDDGKNYASFTSEATLETINGRTTKVSGSIVVDPAHPEAATTDVSIDLTSIDTGIDMRNNHFRSAGFIDTDKFPAATFKSASISSPVKMLEANKPVEFKITGDVTIHGVTKRMVLPVRVVFIPENDMTKSSRGPGDWIHASAQFQVKLQDFNIPVPQKLVLKLADTVNVNLDVFGVARPPAAAAPAAK